MRLSAGAEAQVALNTIAAAADAGVTVFDTAHAYGAGATDRGQNEALLARGIRACGAQDIARIVTKGGMERTAAGWVPDGRAGTILADCEASLLALDGLPIDLFLVHAPDPRTPWRTTLRALARLADEGLVRRVGVCNVNRRQLDEALALTPVAAVQVPLSIYDDSALRGGVVQRCAEAGVTVIAHSPLGGPRRAGRLERDGQLAGVARSRGATPAEVALAWVLQVAPGIVAIPGATRPETARSAARAAHLSLAVADVALLNGRLGRRDPSRVRLANRADGAEVIMIMGIPGAGKSRVAADYVSRGYLRLNRDQRGGSLRDLAEALDHELSAGARRVVLDNTYLTRATRNYVVEAAGHHGLPARCLWVDTPLAQAQVNMVLRLLERFGHLPMPEELRGLARQEPGLLSPTSQMRALREVEAPTLDEGLASLERIAFKRSDTALGSRGGVLVAAGALRLPGWQVALDQGRGDAPHLVFDWIPDGTPDDLAEAVSLVAAHVGGPVEGALCPHGGGPPRCWCRPPLPGLPLEFLRARGLAATGSLLIGTGTAHRSLATALGARYLGV